MKIESSFTRTLGDAAPTDLDDPPDHPSGPASPARSSRRFEVEGGAEFALLKLGSVVHRSTGSKLFSAALILVVLALGGCGKKGDPLPPIRPIPAAADDFEVVQRGDRLLLSAPYPSTTVAGTPLSEVTGASVWTVVRKVPASAELPPPLEPRQFGAAAKPLRTLEGADLEEAVRGSRIALGLTLIDLVEPGEEPGDDEIPVATLAVRTLGPTGQESAFSNLVTLPLREAPAPPTGLELEGRSDGVRLRWEYPEEATAPEAEPEPDEAEPEPEGAESAEEAGTTRGDPEEGESAEAEETAEEGEAGEDEDDGIQGFNVYRRGAAERLYGEPVRTLPRRARSFVDESAILGRGYIYAVTAVAQRRPVLIESALGEESEIHYRDRFPPAAPTGVVALFQEGPEEGRPGRVRVVWRPVDASDLAGYRVYREDSGTAEARALHDEPVSRTELVDEDVTAGGTYVYRVRSVDRSGNESEPSEPASVTVR